MVGLDKVMKQRGFTIVELLIVIVVIGILAAITIVAYNGLQDRANDTAVKNDLSTIAKKLELYKVINERYPYGTTEITNLGFSVSKNSYGNGFDNGEHNLLYCRVAASGPVEFALIASSTSGTVFTYRSSDRQFTEASAWVSTASMNNCIDAGIPQTISNDRDILYLYSEWGYGL